MSDEPPDKFRRLLKSEDETRAEPPSQPAGVHRPLPPGMYPALDKDNMPLPRRVNETDVDGTTVTPAAFETKTHPRYTVAASKSTPGRNGTKPLRGLWRFRNWGCVLQALVVLLFLLVFGGLCMASLALYEYYSIASNLPSVGDLQGHSVAIRDDAHTRSQRRPAVRDPGPERRPAHVRHA